MAVDWAASSQIGVVTNARGESDSAARVSSKLFELAFAGNPTAMAIVDPRGSAVEVNAAFSALVGRERSAVLGPGGVAALECCADPTHHAPLDPRSFAGSRRAFSFRLGDGQTATAEIEAFRIDLPRGGEELYVLTAHYIAGEEDLVARLTHQAFHDPLTGLANRILFEDRLNHALTRAARAGGSRGAVVLLDLDDFKGVNDSLGHHVGDELLVALADRLSAEVRVSDTLCRFGGDEFLLLVEEVDDEGEVERIAARLIGSLAAPFEVAGTSISQDASVGIVPWSSGKEDPTALFARADTAMYEAKRLGKGRYVVFDPDIHERAVRRFELAQEVRGALAAGELSMHFQPLVDLASCRVEGFEALMRWSHPTRGWVPPDEFIGLAEESDLIFELGAFALREATRQAMTWTALDDPAPYVSVNLSTRQLYDPNLVRVVEDALTRSGLPASRLVLEVTETAALGDLDASTQTMQRLVQLGIRVAIDDFGTGYSSLSYLSLTYPKIIKVDRSLVRGCSEDPDRFTLLEGVASLGHSLGAVVVAEGIETAEQLECLRRTGCDVGQGFLFSAAVPPADVVRTARRVEHDTARITI